MTKLSFIVPVYNVAPYLRKCLGSLLAQDFDDYEIILVDDGSTDECPQICDSYAREHTNLRVIHQSNAGLSAARNSGIKVANGEYVCFVDSDDYWQPDVLGALMAQLERDNLDVLRFNYQNVRISKNQDTDTETAYEVFHPNKDPKRDVDFSEPVVDGETFLNERLGPACYAWQFIIRRDLMVNSKFEIKNLKPATGFCLFKEGIYFEDAEWTPRMLLRARRAASTPLVVYNYFWRVGSITLPTDPQKRDKSLRDRIALLRGFKEQQKQVHDPAWFMWMTSATAMSVLGMLATLPSNERKPYLRELESMQIFPLTVKREKILSHKIKTVIANISPSLYCSLMSLRK